MMKCTNKRALEIAIDAISSLPPTEENQAAIETLVKMRRSKWNTHWTKESICEALDKWVAEHGRAPTVTNLCEEGMPAAVTIQTHFDIPAKTFLRHRYSDYIKEKENKYGFKTKEDWIQCFREQFYKHNRPTSSAYNVVRDPDTPTFYTIMNNTGISTWKELMSVANVEYNTKNFDCTKHEMIVRSYSPSFEKYAETNQELCELDRKLIELYKRNELGEKRRTNTAT